MRQDWAGKRGVRWCEVVVDLPMLAAFSKQTQDTLATLAGGVSKI